MRTILTVVVGVGLLATPAAASANNQGTWAELGGGGPSGHSDGDGAGGMFAGNAVSAANETVRALGQFDYAYRWDGTYWDEYSTSYNNVSDIFSPIGGDQYSVLFVDNGNVINGYKCGFFMCYTSYSGSGFKAQSVAGTGGSPYAVAATSSNCGTYDNCVYHYNGSSWTQLGTQGAQQVTVDVGDSNHYPWIVDSSGGIYKWTGSAWANANPPSGIQPGVIAVSNGSVWAVAQDSSGVGVYEWAYGTSSWVNHSSDNGAPMYGIYPSGIAVQNGNTGPYVPIVYVVTSSYATSDPETVWEWSCNNCTTAPTK